MEEKRTHFWTPIGAQNFARGGITQFDEDHGEGGTLTIFDSQEKNGCKIVNKLKRCPQKKLKAMMLTGEATERKEDDDCIVVEKGHITGSRADAKKVT